VALSPTLPLVDRLIPGGLETYLRDARAKGESFQSVRDRLKDEHDITVHPQTVANWCAHYGIEKVEA
jgi:hypothetical protein